MELLRKKMKALPTKVYLAGAVAVIIVLAALSGFLFWKYASVKTGGDTQAEAKATSQRIIGQVGQIYLLPGGEEPTVAQVQDKEKLANQDFFKNAQDGDYILIYKNAKLALIYRENVDKLVNVGPINLDDQQNNQPEGSTKKPN
jgi:hypothetical protein